MSVVERHDQERNEVEQLRTQLRAAHEALERVRVDAFVVEEPAGPQIYTITKADQPFRMIVDTMQQGAVVLTPAGDIFYGNRCFLDMIAMTPDRMIGRPMSNFVDVSDRPGCARLIAQGVGTLEVVLRAPDGRAVPAYLAANRFGGTPANVCLVVTNLTDQKRQATQAALLASKEAARAEAEAGNRAKDEFLTMLSHELRTPLGVILNGVEVLDQTGSAEEGPVRIRAIIRRQARHLAKLLDDLLNVARVTQGRIELERRPLDLVEVVSASAEDHRPEIDRAGLLLTVSIPAGPVVVKGDRTRLLQIIGNLLHNARKYTQAEGQITVSLRRAGEVAELRVRDTGLGIEADMLERIFEPFRQLNPYHGSSGDGLGLGLALVRRLVGLHDGTVEAVSSGPGWGSEFIVRIPAMITTPVLDETKVPLARTGQSLRLLLIEDHDDAREMARLGLELLGQTVHVAADGETGIQMALAEPSDAVIVDLGLPGIDGYQVGRRLREALGDRIRLVALTGYGQPDDRRRVHEAGFDAHLVKPVTPADILAAVTS